jgi:hypothetical protein
MNKTKIQNLKVKYSSTVPLIFNTLGTELNKLLYVFRERLFWPHGKPHMHCVLQLMVSGKMAASCSIFEGSK